MSDNLNTSIPTLTYFKGRGVGQFIRVLHAYLGLPLQVEYVTLPLSDELKKTLPYGQVPIYKFGSMILSQSSTITRYIATKNGFMGKSFDDQFKVDEIVTAITCDLFPSLHPAFAHHYEREKLKIKFTNYFTKYDNILKESKYLVGNSATLADIYLYVTFEFAQFKQFQDFVNSEIYPNIEDLKKRIESNPGVEQYLKDRPSTLL